MDFFSQAFILVGTCRENILFGQPYNREWYDRVISACALLEDFERLPFGDQTKLGDKGISLSGGQRQRLVSSKLW
jgi:ATP-binding cassette, subfamily C (CFTR/MRP), member 1